jgi:hypothetical protein
MQISYRVVSALDLSEKLCRDRIFGRLFPKGIDVALPEVNFCAISSTIPSTSQGAKGVFGGADERSGGGVTTTSSSPRSA